MFVNEEKKFKSSQTPVRALWIATNSCRALCISVWFAVVSGYLRVCGSFAGVEASTRGSSTSVTPQSQRSVRLVASSKRQPANRSM